MDHRVDDDQLAEAVKFNFKFWWAKLSSLKERSYKERAPTFLRALKHLPGSYKLWYHFLTESVDHCKGKCIISGSYGSVNELFERCLVFMHKMPRIWIMFLEFLFDQKLYNRFRSTLDRCLTSLPLTQHEKIWDVATKLVLTVKEATFGKHILERYLKLNPDFIESYVEYLKDVSDWRSVATYLVRIINDDRFVSKSGKTQYDFCMEACKIIATYPDKCVDFDGAIVIRHCITKYTDEVGNLWNCLAEFYILQGLFEKGRDVFEEALEKVASAKDFGIVYSAYLKFEEELLTLAMEEGEDEEEVLQRKAQEDREAQLIDDLLELKSDVKTDIDSYRVSKEELCIKKVESLIERRGALLNSCLLRQKPHSVDLWSERLDLLQRDEQAYVRTFHECLMTIDPFKADGRLSQIWIRFAGHYEKTGDIATSNKIYWKAANSTFKNTDEYVNIWVSWVEMTLRLGAYKDALELIKYPLTQTVSDKRNNLVSSNRLWSLMLDIEINFGSRDSIRQCYQKMIDLAVITPLNLLNFTSYLIENHAYEESFRMFERGLSMFKWPALHAIWANYLTAFIGRYKDKKVERVRDLFERVIDECPEDKRLLYYIMYSEYEEQFGLLNHAIEILDRLTDVVQESEKQRAYEVFVAKVSNYMGLTRTRPIYEKALENFKGKQFILFGQRYAKLEKKLGEIDRARQIFNYLAPMVDPEMDHFEFWKVARFDADLGRV